MSGRTVATYTGSDSGGPACPCQSPVATLSPDGSTVGLISERRVYVEKIAVMAAGDVLTPAPGTVCSNERPPCLNARIVVSSGKVFVGKKPIAHIQDVLNAAAGIKIVGVPTKVFASES